MEQRDYLLKEIEKIGFLLRVILKKVIAFKHTEEADKYEITEQYSKWLLEDLSLNVSDFLSIKDEDVIDYLKKIEGFEINNIQQFAECLFYMGLNLNKPEAVPYLKRAKYIYEWCDTSSFSFSLERQLRISEIQNALVN